ncbi:glycosyl transferase [Kaistia sp. 32K]|uniref:glycosyltransferase n=1 Tax=Kaistia sp. 32K TaxID=2795690 RepID=UPI0019165E80|nr:glycosyltransferase [Kaistia sp. 32K]BCP51886.1 glycosyl transferase [Kaistia sp. 32K]
MAKRKYLFYTRSLAGGGGAERVWALLASHFASDGNDVILAVDGAGDPSVPLDPAVRVEVLPAGNRAQIAALAALLRRFRPDVALSALSGNATKLALAKLWARSSVPLVVSFHGFEEYRTGKLSAAAYYGMPILTKSCSRIVCVSDTLKAVMIERWGAEADKTVRIYNPVPLAPAVVDAATLAARPPEIVAVGRLSPEKGFGDLIAAFALVSNRDATLTIAGEGPEREKLEAEIGALGLAGRVHLAGFTDPAPLYARARLCAIPSRTEAFGMVAVEALAAGLPVVATRCAGPREILDGGRFGTLVPIGDAPAMAQGIDAALADPGDPAPRIERAQAFSSEAGFAAWARLLDEIVKKG